MTKDFPLIAFQDVTKAFGANFANRNLNLTVKAGSIHGLVGENGAGKSTAMNVLYGLYQPTSGSILVRGKACAWRSPADAIAAGIGMVHQHFMLGDVYSVLDNIILGQEPVIKASPLPVALKPMQRQKARDEIRRFQEIYDLRVDLDAPVEELSVGEQQRVEILKLLYRHAEIFILDEPTAVLTPQEVKALFENLRKLKSEGKTVIIITHKLREVMEITDEVTVMRAGEVSARFITSETNENALARAMVGYDVNLSMQAPPAANAGDTVLELSRISLLSHHHGGRSLLKDINLAVKAGEIVGIAGVSGNGQDQLVDLILHPKEHFSHHCADGQLFINGQDVAHYPHYKIRGSGVGVVYADRHRHDILEGAALLENFLLGKQADPRLNRWGWLNRKLLLQRTNAVIARYDVRPPNPGARMGALSGGNQQKFVVGRELDGNPRLFIVCEPTRGVDVGAVVNIHKLLVEHRDKGNGILLISSELDEVMSLSDRIHVIYRGSLIASFKKGEATEEQLGLYMGGKGGQR